MKVSIIIPAYNAQNTIQKAINSVLDQDFSKDDFEIIVINDGSTDNTSQVLEKYKSKIKIINQKNVGAVAAANVGFKKATGKYIIKLDSDDYFKNTILKKMADVLDNKQNIDFVYCDYYERSSDGKISVVSIKDNLFNLIAGGIMFRTNKFKEQGFYDENFGFAEYDLLLKTLGSWLGFYIQDPLFWYVRRKESLTGDKKWLKNAMKELKDRYPDKIDEIKKIRIY